MKQLNITSWNIKGWKSDKKNNLVWNQILHDKGSHIWALQEHHLDASQPRTQSKGQWLCFYGDSPSGFNGVCTIVSQNLKPSVFLNHQSSKILGVSI